MSLACLSLPGLLVSVVLSFSLEPLLVGFVFRLFVCIGDSPPYFLRWDKNVLDPIVSGFLVECSIECIDSAEFGLYMCSQKLFPISEFNPVCFRCFKLYIHSCSLSGNKHRGDCLSHFLCLCFNSTCDFKVLTGIGKSAFI